MALKLLLFSVDGTLADAQGKIHPGVINDFSRLLLELHNKGVQVALWSTRRWTYNGNIPLEQYLSTKAGFPIPAFGNTLARRRGNAAQPVMAHFGVAKHETLLLGGTEEDMRAGVNSGLLHIRPTWYGDHTSYGFPVATVSDLARFCFVFAMRQHPIFFRVHNGPLFMQAAGPFSTQYQDYAAFGFDARAAAKVHQGHPDFWFYLTISTLYFSAMLDGANYICIYPGHQGHGSIDPDDSMAATLARMGRCFNISFYHDLIGRHTAAPKSQPIKAAQRTFAAQLNTLQLNKRPHRNLSAEANKSDLSLKGKNVLVVDDICTSGKSLESARLFLESAGANVRLFSWLKTISVPYVEMVNRPSIKPYQPNTVAEPGSLDHNYSKNIIDQNAATELAMVFKLYTAWKW